MRFVSVLPIMLLFVPAMAAAQSMNAELFLKKAAALEKKGPLAVFSGDLKVVMNEGKASAGKARAMRLAAVKAGQKPRYCPPAAAGGMNSDEYMRGLKAIPAAERAKIDITEATTRILATKFPCPR